MKKVIIKINFLIAVFIFLSSIQGCDNSVSQKTESESLGSSAGLNHKENGSDINSIKIGMEISFGKNSLSMNKLLESNIGTHFNKVTKIDAKIAPGKELDLQEIQPNGIFGLFLNSSDIFILKNLDGMMFNSKSLLLEKCSFIDLIVINPTAAEISITGFVAGE